MDPKVKEYIEKQDKSQQEIINIVRKLIHKAVPDCDEGYRWGVIALSENRFYIAAMRDRVHVGFAINGLNKEEIALFEGSGKTMRHIKIHSLKELDEKELVKLIKLVQKKATCVEE